MKSFPKSLILIILAMTVMSLAIIYVLKKKTVNYALLSPQECISDINCAWHVFSNVALKTEFQKNHEGKVKKFPSKNIEIMYVVEDKKEYIDKMLFNLYKDIKAKTSVNLDFKISTPQIIVFFVNDYDFSDRKDIEEFLSKYLTAQGFSDMQKFLQNTHHSNCYVKSIVDNNNLDIKKSFVFISTRLPEKMVDLCVQEEIVQGMGLFNDVKNYRSSLFNDSLHPIKLTELDFLMLDILYNDEIKSGMTSEEIKPIFNRIYKKGKDRNKSQFSSANNPETF